MKKLSNGMAQVGHGPLRILTARAILRQWLRFAKQSLGIGWLDICGSLRTAATGHNIVFENQASAVRRPEILGDYGHRSACPWKYID